MPEKPRQYQFRTPDSELGIYRFNGLDINGFRKGSEWNLLSLDAFRKISENRVLPYLILAFAIDKSDRMYAGELEKIIQRHDDKTISRDVVIRLGDGSILLEHELAEIYIFATVPKCISKPQDI